MNNNRNSAISELDRLYFRGDVSHDVDCPTSECLDPPPLRPLEFQLGLVSLKLFLQQPIQRLFLAELLSRGSETHIRNAKLTLQGSDHFEVFPFAF